VRRAAEQAAQHRQKRMRIGPRHLHLPACDIRQFVDNLHADGAAGSDSRLGTIHLHGIA
jgi:hypothetical protein